MRLAVLLLLAACSSNSAPVQQPARAPEPGPPPVSPTEPASPQRAMQRLAADTPTATTAGNTFIAPAEWSLGVEGSATLLQSPEGDSWIALVDVAADSADQAVALAWAAYAKDKKLPLKVVHPGSDKDGWTRVATYEYTTSPNEKRNVSASVRFADGMWTVAILDLSDATGDRRHHRLEHQGDDDAPRSRR